MTTDVSQFGKGAEKDKFDIRDHRLDLHITKFGAPALPAEYSVRNIADKTPVKNQGSSLSCGGQAVSKYIQILTFLRDGLVDELSAKDVYQPVRMQGGGSAARDLIKRVMNSGVALEKDIPSYDNGQPPAEQFMATPMPRTPDAQQRAMQHWIKNYMTYDSTDPEQVKQAIYQGSGAFIAVVGNNPCWTTPDGIIQVPAQGTTNWGHFFVLTGWKLINSQLYFEFVNSWNGWGDHGYGYLPAQYLIQGFGYNEWTLVEAPAQLYNILTLLIMYLKNLIDLLKGQKTPNT